MWARAYVRAFRCRLAGALLSYFGSIFDPVRDRDRPVDAEYRPIFVLARLDELRRNTIALVCIRYRHCNGIFLVTYAQKIQAHRRKVSGAGLPALRFPGA